MQILKEKHTDNSHFFQTILTEISYICIVNLCAFLMALYILILGAVPCNDLHNKCNTKNALTEITKNQNHQKDTKDICTPFCTCACCGASVVILDFTLFQIKRPPAFAITQKITIRNFSFVSNYFGNIWQPPKITTTC